MKYIEKIGEVETVYEGTPQEIMDLYNKIDSEGDFKKMIDDDARAKEHYDNMKHFKLMPSGMHELDIDEIGNEIARKMSLALNQF